MSNRKISELNPLTSLDSSEELAIVDGNETKRITVAALLTEGLSAVTAASISSSKISYVAGGIATAAIADNAITTAKLGDAQVSGAKISNNAIVVVQSSLPTSGQYTGQLALTIDDNKLYVWNGTQWVNSVAPGSINAFTDTTSGIINISTAVSSGTATITASIDDTTSAAQFLAGPVGSAGTVGYRTIDGGDLPTATTTSKGGVIVNGGGLTLNTDTIQIDNSVTASSTKHLVTYDANGLINGGAAITSADLPVATNSAKGAVSVPTNEGLAVDANGNLSINNTVTSGTYTKVTVTAKGVVSAGDTLDAADIPDHSAAKLTSGTINTSLIANDSITADKLANESTVKFGGALGSDNVTIFPTGDFKGQLFWDETSLDLYVYTGSAFIPITVLSGNLVNAGTYNASTNLVSSVTTAGSSAGFSAGSALPAPAGTNLNHYVVVETSGTGSGAAPAVALAPPDMLLSNGVGTEYRLIDVSNAIAGQTAANISFIASGTIAATDVQAALQEVDSEKLAIAGGTMTGDLNLGTSTNVVFEGSSADDYETTLTVTDPTADRTLALPNVSGTLVSTGDTGSVTSTMIADGAIVNADINASAEIAVSKLANGTARQLLQTDAGGSGVEFTSNVDVPGTLDVTSAATFDSTVDVTGLLSANGKLAYPAGSAAAVSLYSGSDTDTGIYSPGSNQFGIATAGTSRIVVDASGNVGIGTTPAVNLHVKNASSTGRIRIEGGGSSSAQLQFIAGGQTNPYVITQDASRNLIFFDNASERLQVDSAGRLLVGTSSDIADVGIVPLQVVQAGGGGIILARNDTSVSDGNDLGYIRFMGNDTTSNTYTSLGLIQCEADGTHAAGDNPTRLVFSTTADGASSPTERLRIDSSGNATFTGNITAAGKIESNFTGGNMFEADAVFGNNNCAYRSRHNGNAGSNSFHFIGTSNDGKRIDIKTNGDIQTDGSAEFAGDFTNGSFPSGNGLKTDVSNGILSLRNDNASATNGTEQAFRIYSGGQNQSDITAKINASGSAIFASNIGIGTSSPYSASGYNSLTLNGSTGSQIRFRTGDSDKGLIYNTANDFNIFSFDNPLRFHTNSTEQMRLDSSGRLLVGTSTARTNFNNGGNSAEFQVEGFGKGSFMRNLNDQFGASLFLTKSRSTGNSVLNSSDTIGNISFQGNDGTDFVPTAIISCQVDGTPGANDMPGRLVFSTTADGSSSPTERMRIDHTGTSFFMSAGNVIGALTDLGAGTTRRLYYGGHSRSGIGTNHVTFTVWTNGDVQNTNNSYGSLSDVKLKENIVDAKSQWADIKDLRVRNYNFIEGQTHTQIGVVAQEVETVSPGLVYETPDRDENDNDLGTVTKSVNYSVLYMKAVKALQEAMERIETLETKVAALEAG